MKTTENQLRENCLKYLSEYSKPHLLEELEQLLLSHQEKGNSLSLLNEYYSKGGLRQPLNK